MNENQELEIVSEKPLTVRPPEAAPQSAAQAKVDAISALTLSAYQKASQLALTDEEIAKLTEEFPDGAFKQGAAGKDNLIYIEHAFLRDRLNSVFRPGQWAIVPRNRWAEEFKTSTGKDASRVYVEAMLCIRGCFAAEAVGEMEYYPHNAGQNYGDAVEGAKTAALRRCCKELGIGLQAWKKDWCEGWWQRKRGGTPTPQKPVSAPTRPVPATPAPAKAADVLPKAATDATRSWMLKELEGYGETDLLAYARDNALLLPTELITDWPLEAVPTSKEGLRELMHDIEAWKDGDWAPAAEDEAWRTFPIPFGKNAGKLLGEVEKPTLFGFWANFTVEQEYNGKPKKPETIAKDQAFRDALDAAGQHYEFTKND